MVVHLKCLVANYKDATTCLTERKQQFNKPSYILKTGQKWGCGKSHRKSYKSKIRFRKLYSLTMAKNTLLRLREFCEGVASKKNKDVSNSLDRIWVILKNTKSLKENSGYYLTSILFSENNQRITTVSGRKPQGNMGRRRHAKSIKNHSSSSLLHIEMGQGGWKWCCTLHL